MLKKARDWIKVFLARRREKIRRKALTDNLDARAKEKTYRELLSETKDRLMRHHDKLVGFGLSKQEIRALEKDKELQRVGSDWRRLKPRTKKILSRFPVSAGVISAYITVISEDKDRSLKRLDRKISRERLKRIKAVAKHRKLHGKVSLRKWSKRRREK